MQPARCHDGIVSLLPGLASLLQLGLAGISELGEFSLQVATEDKDDCLYNIMDLSRRFQLELLAVLTHPILEESAVMVTLRVNGNSVDKFVKALWEAGYRVSDGRWIYLCLVNTSADIWLAERATNG